MIPNRHGQGTHGFTLIELLVVITILAILASMLMSGISLVRNAAQKVSCQSNLRQMGMAIIAYSGANEGLVLPLIGGNGQLPREDMGQLHLLAQGDYLQLPGTANLTDPVSTMRSIVRCPAGLTSRLSTSMGLDPYDPVMLFPGRWTVTNVPQGTMRYYDSWYTWNATYEDSWDNGVMCHNMVMAGLSKISRTIFLADGVSPLHPSGFRIAARHNSQVNLLFAVVAPVRQSPTPCAIPLLGISRILRTSFGTVCGDPDARSGDLFMTIDLDVDKDPAAKSGLAQVALRAQVSLGTVSRVFNNSSQIPLETRMRVLKVARDLGIRPRVGVRSKHIAIVTEPPSHTVMGGYVNTLTQHLCYALSREGAGITLITEDRIEQLASSWFDGVIGVAWQDSTIHMLKALGNLPVVWFSDMHGDSFHAVYLDCVETGLLAGDYLTGRGHRRIAVIHDADYAGLGRVEGVAQAMAERGLDVRDNLLRIPNTTPMHLSMKQLLNAGCTAVWVTGEDLKVLETNWLLQELAGKKVPDDISLLGFENPGISEFQRPALTTIASPLHEMAERAVDLLMRGDLTRMQKIKLSTRIIERDSVRTLA